MDLNFKLTEQEAQIVLNALTKEPYIIVVDVVNKMQKQASEQMKVKKHSCFIDSPNTGV